MPTHDATVYRRGEAEVLGVRPELDIYSIFLRLLPSKADRLYSGMVFLEDSFSDKDAECSCRHLRRSSHNVAEDVVGSEELVIWFGFRRLGAHLWNPLHRGGGDQPIMREGHARCNVNIEFKEFLKGVWGGLTVSV